MGERLSRADEWFRAQRRKRRASVGKGGCTRHQDFAANAPDRLRAKRADRAGRYQKVEDRADAERRDEADRHVALGIARFLGRSEEHTSELQSLMRISYAVFCLKKNIKNNTHKR